MKTGTPRRGYAMVLVLVFIALLLSIYSVAYRDVAAALRIETVRTLRQQRDEGEALQAVAVMQQATVVELTASVALRAVELSLEHRLPMADSVILATARVHKATLWTQDEDFEGLESVRYAAKQPRTAV